MKLLWVSHFVPYPPRGGAPQRSYNLLKEAGREAEVHFAGLSLRGHQPDRDGLQRAREALGAFCETVEVVPTAVRSSPLGKLWSAARALGTGRSYGETWLDFAASRRLIRDTIEKHRPDVVHVDSVMIADLLPTTYRGPAILNHHNIESHMMERRAVGKQGVASAYLGHEAAQLRKLEQRSAGRFTRHIVTSDLDGQRLAEIVGNVQWETVPNGVDVEYFHPQSSQEEPSSLVFCGRMSWYPNDEAMCQFLRELWPEIRRRRPNTRLRIVGMHPSSRLKTLAKDDERIAITGFVDDVRPEVGSAALYICPILDGGGTRLKLLDAMALGKAIVATPLAVEGLDLQDGRDVVVREFGAPFIDSVLTLLDDDDRRAALAGEARRTAVARYSWTEIGAKLRSVYAEALAEFSQRVREDSLA